MSLYLMSLMTLKLMSLSIHVPDLPQINVLFNPYPYSSCPLTNSMFLKLMVLLFHVPVFYVPQPIPCPSKGCPFIPCPYVPQIDDPFNPCYCISCPLTNSMSLKFMFLSIDVPIFHVP